MNLVDLNSVNSKYAPLLLPYPLLFENFVETRGAVGLAETHVDSCREFSSVVLTFFWSLMPFALSFSLL